MDRIYRIVWIFLIPGLLKKPGIINPFHPVDPVEKKLNKDPFIYFRYSGYEAIQVCTNWA